VLSSDEFGVGRYDQTPRQRCLDLFQPDARKGASNIPAFHKAFVEWNEVLGEGAIAVP